MKITVLGSGGWGTALALLLLDNGNDVTLWSHREDGAAELLLEQAEALEERGDFWPEYADIIAAWNEGTVLFDQEGMLVVFSHYVLGPYAMGTVELRLDYGQLAELVGAGGMARLGIG